MRIALYTLPRIEFKKKGVAEYHRNQLEKLYSDVSRSGRISEEFLSLYTRASDLLDSGDIRGFKEIFKLLKEMSEDQKKTLEFDYTPPCENCALISLSEGEYALKIMKRGLVNGNRRVFFKKIFFVYDWGGNLKAAGGIVPVDVLIRTFQESFMAVA